MNDPQGHDPAANLTHRWAVAGQWKVILPREGAAELYDLAVDPHEQRNLARTHPELVAALQAELPSFEK